jgi:hypothetical protein
MDTVFIHSNVHSVQAHPGVYDLRTPELATSTA